MFRACGAVELGETIHQQLDRSAYEKTPMRRRIRSENRLQLEENHTSAGAYTINKKKVEEEIEKQ